MPRNVTWKLRFKDLASVQASERLGERFNGALGLIKPSKLGEAKQSEEQPGLWEISMTTEFASPSAQGVLNLLWQASCLASGWNVYGPVLCDNGEVVEFFGMFNELKNTRAQVWGLEWASFQVDSWPPSRGA